MSKEKFKKTGFQKHQVSALESVSSSVRLPD
jgi:hypothetical protein